MPVEEKSEVHRMKISVETGVKTTRTKTTVSRMATTRKIGTKKWLFT